jgi:hypothetical protein
MLDPALSTPLAYLDPGSGAILLQLLAAGVAGFVVFFRYQGRRVKAFFRRGGADERDDSAEDS